MTAHFTDRQKKRIIADRVDGLSLRKIAAKYGCSANTVKAICDKDPTLAQKFAEKKEQNTQDMMAFLESQSESAQEFVKMALEAIKDPAKLEKASVQTIATALGIVIDKFTPIKKQTDDDKVTIVWGR